MQGVLICVPIYTFAALLLGASITAGIFVFHVAVVPLIFKYSKTFRRHLIFANFVQWPLNVDFDDVKAGGVDGGRNFYIEYKSKVDNCDIKIGVWHILPKSAYEKLKGNFEGTTDKEELNRLMDSELTDSKYPIMLYCHGNSNSRATSHRVQMYKFFQQMDYHTVAFDYRGYGDSTKVTPSEDGVVEDALIVYDWLHTTVDKAPSRPPIYIWGHSLGTGISSHLLGNLDKLSKNILERPKPLPLPNGLILEAPFNNLEDEVHYHPLAKLVSWLPYFESSFVSPFAACRVHAFRSDKHLARAPHLPALLLHARDDRIVPHCVGHKLYRSVLESRAAGGATIKLHSYDEKENLGHKWICLAKDLSEVVGEFVSSHR
ncbi:lysophosphatidylserine lipase ABHD12-like isoform X1 [Nymphalis io]|uniref:lysophosphatidylserine lipase ABHD12-like isoform X1 n=1 Tax=Inachis io TaxID=171585 RepID=UPI00216A2DAD|nr:lysophosphatidylserine lipase ABHD12-like isoform X1 [Nymphalis io]